MLREKRLHGPLVIVMELDLPKIMALNKKMRSKILLKSPLK